MISCTRRLVEGDEKEINFVFCGRCATSPGQAPLGLPHGIAPNFPGTVES